MRTLLAFSKRFVGAGHSENGGGQGAEGTLPRCHLVQFAGSEGSKLYFICTTLFTIIFNKMTIGASLVTHYSSFVIMIFATKIRFNCLLY